ncbi:MAG: ankyrin repeat domain-containing protein [Gammaproteobacteria bacterium]
MTEEEKKESPLLEAIIKGDIRQVEQLIASKSGINEKGDNGLTPLHCAAMSGQPEIALALVKMGADLFAVTTEGKTPLDWACVSHNQDSVIAHVLKGAMEWHNNKNKQKAERLLREL